MYLLCPARRRHFTETVKNPEAEAKKADGNAEFAAKNYDSAILKYTEAIAIEANHVYYCNRSAVYLAKKDWENAELDAAKCVEMERKFVKGYFRLATAQVEQDKIDEATATVRAGLKENEGSPELNRLLRVCKAKKEQLKKGPGSKQNQGGPTPEMLELHEKLQSTGRELNQVNAKLQGAARDKKRAHFTMEEVQNLPADCNTYRSIGKMFLMTPRAEIKDLLESTDSKCDENEKTLLQQKAFYERRAASQEANLRDLMTGGA